MSNTSHPSKVVFLDTGTFPQGIKIRDLSFPHEFVSHEKTTPDEVVSRIADADIVITTKVPLRREVLSHEPKLKFIAVAATGYDVIDLDACVDFGVTVSTIRNYAVNTVPEHTFALILALRRSITAYRQSVAAGDWQKSGQFCYFEYPINDLSGSTLGIIGDGVLGRAVADLGRAFGMRVLFSSYRGYLAWGRSTPLSRMCFARAISSLFMRPSCLRLGT
jgi:glycerate dehydrogenase